MAQPERTAEGGSEASGSRQSSQSSSGCPSSAKAKIHVISIIHVCILEESAIHHTDTSKLRLGATTSIHT